MYLQSTHQVVDCPICGRTLELQSQWVDEEIACSHCRGEFTVYEACDGSFGTCRRDGVNLLARAEQLLSCCVEPGACAAGAATGSPSSETWSHLSEQEQDCDTKPLPTAILVDDRDEVFARLATDIAESGLRVLRATSAMEALQLCAAHTPVLVVANVALSDQSGWLLAAKLRFVDRRTCIWLYQTQSSEHELDMVNFLNVDEVLDYRGDLLGLSGAIIDLMQNWREPEDVSSGYMELAAA